MKRLCAAVLLVLCATAPACSSTEPAPSRIGDPPPEQSSEIRQLLGYERVNQELRHRLLVPGAATERFQLHQLLGTPEEARELENILVLLGAWIPDDLGH